MLHSVMADPGELVAVAERLEKATRPEHIFGDLTGTPSEQLKQARRIYRRIAVISHPDVVDGDRALAARAFTRLNELWERAQKQIAAGVYGTRAGAGIGLRILGKRHRYTLEGLLGTGDIADIYECLVDEAEHGIFKLARRPTSAPFIQTEARVLRQIASEVDDRQLAYFPSLLESVRIRGKGGVQRVANVMQMPAGLYSLAEVVDIYRKMGRRIDPKDMAWIWRRLLTALGATHKAGVIHGAVLPTHVLIQAEEHGVVLVGWGTSLHQGEIQRTISKAYNLYYPNEVFKHQPVSEETDIFMAALCMTALLGAHGRNCPDHVPKQLRAFFRACTLPKQNMRPDDAWELKETFDDLIERLWGPRRFRPFYMPRR